MQYSWGSADLQSVQAQAEVPRQTDSKAWPRRSYPNGLAVFRTGRHIPAHRSLPLRDRHQLALGLLRSDIRSESLEHQRCQLCPISGRLPMTSFVSHVPLMRCITQEGHGIRDLLCITTSHEGEVMTHKGSPRMDILCASPIETRRFLGLPLHHGKWRWGRRGVRSRRQMRKSRSAPTIPSLGRGTSYRDWGTWQYGGI